MRISIKKSSKIKTRIVFTFNNNKIKDHKGEYGDLDIRYEGNETLIYCGLGKESDLTSKALRNCAADGIRKISELKRKDCAVSLPEDREDYAEALIEGIVLGSYTFSKYKSEKQKQPESAEILSSSITASRANGIRKLSESVCYARDLVNENAGDMTPQDLASEARKLGKSSALSCKIMDMNEIKRNGMGLLEAVGKGSEIPPKLIILEYTTSKTTKPHLLVGKGITFDSGGINLKPSGHIETMRADMAGGAAVLGTMRALSQLKPRGINVVGVVPAAWNAIGSHAFIPGDIYKSFSGKSVEIKNTDAEGRLVLADALSYCIKKYKPKHTVDLATLTGAILYALGSFKAGVFSNNDELSRSLIDAGEKTGELLWKMPLEKEHSEAMKGELADLRNTSKLPRGHASSSTAAAFIKEFVSDAPWAHIDIAGTAFNEQEQSGITPKSGTGFGVRLLYRYLTEKR